LCNFIYVFKDSLTAYVRHYFMANFTRRQACNRGRTLWKKRAETMAT